MVGGFDIVANPGVDGFCVGEVDGWLNFFSAVVVERRLRRESPGSARGSVRQSAMSLSVVQVVEADIGGM